MRKLTSDQRGILLIPIIAGVLVLSVAGTLAFSRVKQSQLNQQQNASSKSLQDSIADSTKKLALKEEQKKEDRADEVKVPAVVEEQKPAPAPTQKQTTTTTKSTTKTETTKTTPTQPTGTLSLVSTGGKNVGWSLDGNALYGLKLVWSSSPGPVYPGSSAKYYSAGSTTSASIDAEAGNYYVRVCMYYEGKCLNYSNEIYITIP